MAALSRESVVDDDGIPMKMIERAVVARSFILLQSTYFIFLSTAWDDPRSQYMLGIPFLKTAPAFFFAGLVGLAVVVRPRCKPVVILWLVAVGLACLGRTATVIGDPDFTVDERWRNLGWVVQWAASLVGIVQIWAAGVFRGRRSWSG